MGEIDSILQVQNIRFVPTIHRRVTFAEAVRREVAGWRPDVIAVELPATLEDWIVRGALRLPRVSVVCYPEPGQDGKLGYVPIDPCDAIIESVRLGCRHEIPLAFIDLDLPGYREPHRFVPDDVIVDKTGFEAFVEHVAPLLMAPAEDAGAWAREDHMARRLRELAAQHERVLCVIGLAHFMRLREMMRPGGPAPRSSDPPGALRARPGALLADAARESLNDVLGEIPYFTWLFEASRENLEMTGDAGFDKFGALQTILRQAADTYSQTYRQTINMTQWRGLFQFTRNLAMVEGRLRPDLYELVIGARGIVDGDYGYEVSELARRYPPQDDEAKPDDLPSLRLKKEKGRLEGHDEQFFMQPRWEDPETESIRIGFRRRPSKEMMEHWKEDWERSFHLGICSWPPEDEIQERFMDFLRKRALQSLSDDRKHVEEFSTSLLDGLDIRETMRNWHTQKLYVQATPQPQGRVGAVVLIFEDEPLGRSAQHGWKGAFSWRRTLYAENQNESDISFYATPLGGQVVGPRISRTYFGGILSIYPSLRIPDIWALRVDWNLTHCSDVLLAAALLFSPDRYVAYIDRHPPRQALKELAALRKKHIIHLPIQGFSPAHLKKIRNFHILDGRDVRAWARDFIFDN